MDDKEKIEKLCSQLEDMIHNARLLKQCPEYDGCDICKSEKVLRACRQEA